MHVYMLPICYQSFKEPVDRYQETYQGTALGPEKLTSGSVMVIEDKIQQKYLAVELGEKETLAGKYNVFSTGNKGLYVRITDQSTQMPIRQVTSANSKINMALATLGQFIQVDSKTTMEQVYKKHLYDSCMHDRKDIAVSIYRT